MFFSLVGRLFIVCALRVNREEIISGPETQARRWLSSLVWLVMVYIASFVILETLNTVGRWCVATVVLIIGVIDGPQ